MKIKIQNTNEAVKIREIWELEEFCKKDKIKKEECGNAIIAGQFFLECFPRFKEIIINTEFTEDVQANIKD